MRNFRFPEPTACVVMAYDAINYLRDRHEIRNCLRHLGFQLEPGGLLVFDSNTPEIYRRYHGVREEFTVPGGRIIQKTRYRPLKKLGITRFIFDIDGERSQEEHVQRVYSPGTMQKLIVESGLELLASFDDFTLRPVRASSQKPLFIARRPSHPVE
jgi:hypothetical protein